ncbi:hypothetical protein [Arthrobacter sp. NPDC057013]
MGSTLEQDEATVIMIFLALPIFVVMGIGLASEQKERQRQP